MAHPLEIEYRLTATESLDAIASRFRLKVALEGRVAEVHLGKQVKALRDEGLLASYEEHDRNGYPDFTIIPRATGKPLLVECKNVRGGRLRQGRGRTGFVVEVQKTRVSIVDRTTRYYDVGYFDILGACLGKQTGDWSAFVFIKSEDLARHPEYPNKLDVMQPVPSPTSRGIRPWFRSLRELLQSL